MAGGWEPPDACHDIGEHLVSCSPQVTLPDAAARTLVPPSRTTALHRKEHQMIILGVILLIIGFVTGVAIIWTIGIIVVIVGAILALLGFAGHAVGGRRHYY